MKPIPETARRGDWPRLVALTVNRIIAFVTDLASRLDVLEGFAGMTDEANSTTTALGANEEFIGEWTSNNNSQIAFNALSDQYAEGFLEFSIDGSAALQTLSKPYQFFPGEPEFDALVKMPGRFHRIRVVNGPVAQSDFGLLVSTAPNGLYPYAKSRRDEPVGFAYNTGPVSAAGESYAILVDLDDRTNFPHHNTKSLSLHASNFFINRSSNSEGQVQIGVITRIDGTEADIAFIQGVSFSGSSEREFPRDRDLRWPIHLNQSEGKLTRFVSAFQLTTTDVNTGVTLGSSSPAATAITPAVGDMILRVVNDAGSFTAAVSGQYTGSAST